MIHKPQWKGGGQLGLGLGSGGGGERRKDLCVEIWPNAKKMVSLDH